MTDKFFIDAQSLLQDSFRLAHQVYESGFRPDFIIGIWRGGAPIGIAVQEYFEYRQIATDHIAVRTSSYYGIGQQSREIKVHGLHYLIENANAENSLLIVDDIFDSGRSVEALIAQIQQQMRKNAPQNIKVACPWYKPENNKTAITPDYFVRETSEWIVFPHELTSIDKAELLAGKGDLTGLEDIF
jgi:hypoxanthine phosphoribosyltransferase